MQFPILIKMAKFSLNSIIRKNIRNLVPYSSARNEFDGIGSVLLDANESPYNQPYNRYPDPLQRDLKSKISIIYGVAENSIFLGNGSDEAIDLLIRAFCIPGKDNIISIDPSYGMYEVCAHINDTETKKVLLNPDFSLNSNAVMSAVDAHSKLIFLCSPNNPTSNLLNREQILRIVNNFRGLVILDEAYIDFSGSNGLINDQRYYPNLVILRTFSKAWGLAGVRLGMAFGDPDIITVLNKIKYPYNINILTQKHVINCLDTSTKISKWIAEIIEQRNFLSVELKKFSFVEQVYPSDANFLLVKTTNPRDIYTFLRDDGLVVRDRSKVSLCEGCLRITIGNPKENSRLLKSLTKLMNNKSYMKEL
jgi:histidinol-phosphate aminotransferase